MELYSSFWGEGVTDERFYPILIKRVLYELLYQCARGQWDVETPIPLQSEQDTFVASVLDIARQSKGYTMVFVHTDADAPTLEKVLQDKVTPALKEITKLDGNTACKYVIPILPVTKTENWKLADLDAVSQILGVNDLDRKVPDLNKNPETLEQYADSKDLLKKVLAAVGGQGRRKSSFDPVVFDNALANKISLQALNRFHSFRYFLEGLKKALIDLNIIEENCSPHF
jgi:Domain of unknown function (DUF4276)